MTNLYHDPAAREAAQRADEAELGACSRCGHAASEHRPGCHDYDDSQAAYRWCPCAYYVHWPEEDAAREALHQRQAAAAPARDDLDPAYPTEGTPKADAARWLANRGLPPMAGAAEHTHPCPTCHQARPCAGTGCADGPRECSTCSQCRGW